MNLVIDIGNTLTKLAVFDGPVLHDFIRVESDDTQRILEFSNRFSMLHAGIISSVRTDSSQLIHELSSQMKCIALDHTTPIPFTNGYASPETLGRDRLSGMAAAAGLFPNENVLVIDSGTAITFDLLSSDGTYRGGSISPGIQMRYKALHTFTGRLPLLTVQEQAELIGSDTSGSIHSGILNGIACEVQGMIDQYLVRYSSLKIILTGGDYKYFDKRLKVKTFAAPNLVLEGLNIILNYNLEKQHQQ